jgi:hypothetical protein
MTFFANAGVKWPKVESELRDAGTHALAAGAELWRLISKIESRPSDRGTQIADEDGIRLNCVSTLKEAVEIYSRSLKEIGEDTVLPLTETEVRLAAIPYFSDGIENYIFRSGGATTRELYFALIHRIQNLSSLVANLNLNNDRRELIPQVFRAMREWELISTTARMIAVVNLRNDGRETIAQ